MDADTERRLEERAARLLSQGDHAAVIRLVETWSGACAPSQRARVMEGRAFLGLCQVDRALMRAREAHETAGEDPAALRLLAEVYLARGWPVRARKPLDALKALGDPAPELWARVSEIPPRPEVGAREIERDGDPATLLPLAEAFLLTGSTLRATGILERLRRGDPGNGRVAELLWGIAGDFTSGARDLADYAAPQPQVAGMTLLPTSATTDFEEEAAHTEAVKLDQAMVEAPPAAGAFPSLFRRVEKLDRAEEDGIEPTLSSLRSAPRAGDPAKTGSSDTVVRAVVAHRVATSRFHGARDGDPVEVFDLRAWQESHGMSEPEGTSDLGGAGIRRRGEVADREATSDLGPAQRRAGPVRLGPASVIEDTANDRMESEDAHVVVLRQGPPAPVESPRLAREPIEVIEKYPEPPRASPRMPLPASPPPRLPLRPAQPSSSPGPSLAWLAVPVALAALAVVAVLAWAWSSGGPTARLRADLLATLGTLDYAAYVEKEAEIQAADDSVAVGAALAELRLATWTEFSSEPSRVNAAREFLAAAEALDPHRRAMLRATLALGEGDLQAARAALGRPTPKDDEELLLVGRVLAAAGDSDAARQALGSITSAAPRYVVGRARVLAGLGDPAAARVALQALPRAGDLAATRLLLVQTPERAKTPAERVAAADIFLRDFGARGLPPAYEARAQCVRASGYQELDLPERAREAVSEGLRHDGANPELLVLDAADAALAQSLVTAESTLARARAGRPGDAALRAAHVGLLLDLDRVEAAAAIADGVQDEQHRVLSAWVAVVGRGDPPSLAVEPRDRESPVGAWVAALAANQARDPDAIVRANAAVDALLGSRDPFERRLAPRAKVLAGVWSGVQQQERVLAEAKAMAPDDPAVHLGIARAYEARGDRLRASLHYDRAAELGPDFALAHYERGRFYADAADGLQRSKDAWGSYAALGPSGPRADRARQGLAVQ